MAQIFPPTKPLTSEGGRSALTVRLRFETMYILQIINHFHHLWLMFSCRLFVQWDRRRFAKYENPRLFSQFQILHFQTIQRFGSFESVQEKAEKFALHVENHEFALRATPEHITNIKFLSDKQLHSL